VIALPAMSDAPRIAVGLVCAYEAVAIFSRRVPTVSSLCWNRRVLIPVILGGLAMHLLRPPLRQA
jgi:hypothetical protein